MPPDRPRNGFVAAGFPRSARGLESPALGPPAEELLPHLGVAILLVGELPAGRGPPRASPGGVPGRGGKTECDFASLPAAGLVASRRSSPAPAFPGLSP